MAPRAQTRGAIFDILLVGARFRKPSIQALLVRQLSLSQAGR
jgi:hypothetical protein